MRLSGDNILVVGDTDRRMQSAVAVALPSASITAVRTVFDAIAELSAGLYHGVLVNADPLESRPEAATRALREAAGDSRIVLWADAAHEPLTRRLITEGADDYVIAPAGATELQQTLAGVPEGPIPTSPAEPDPAADALRPLLDLPLTDIVLSAMLDHPHRAVDVAIEAINNRVGPPIVLHLHNDTDPAPVDAEGRLVVTHPLRAEGANGVSLSLDVARPVDESAAHHALSHLCSVLGKVRQIDARQARLQKMAITDELTGLSNARFFRHFLARMIEKAKTKRFPVTLLLFDIDNFKKYNDTFGHPVGDEILKQTANLIKRCTRDHDMVARISGDEFAVVFWEKEGPRQPYPEHTPTGRLPSTPLQIADRFRKLLCNREFTEFSLLGAAGKGTLTISGGMAVYPYDARTPEELIEAADRALMFGAKKAGRTASISSATSGRSTPPNDLWSPLPVRRGRGPDALNATGGRYHRPVARTFGHHVFLEGLKMNAHHSTLILLALAAVSRGQDQINFSKAMAAAERGDVAAMVDVGICYANGNGVERDPAKAIEWYTRAWNAGDAAAAFNLGGGYFSGQFFPDDRPDYAKAKDWLTKADAKKDHRATRLLGIMAQDGLGQDRDPKAAVALYERGISLGDKIEAPNLLGSMLLDGDGVPADPKRAMTLFKSAADAGNAEAARNLGICYLHGKGTAKDPKQAVPHFEKAATAGDAQALYTLGEMHRAGEGVDKDLAKAVIVYEKAADAGYAPAMNKLGNLYERGEGVDKNPDKAFDNYARAARVNDPDGLNNLGVMFDNGIGTGEDAAKAFANFEKAAKAGHLGAMKNLSILYENGRGCEKNPDAAAEWMKKYKDAGGK